VINIKINSEYLVLPPNTQIQRERQSPFFLSLGSGKDGIPGEVSYPFNLPLNDRNMRLLGYSDHLPAIRQKIFDQILFDDINQVSGGKLQMRDTTMSLNAANLGQQQCNLLCNSSAFFKLIEKKKLKDLTLGGARTFAWDGYNVTSGTGFWKHCHDTWEYENCDDGDYVFFWVASANYGGYSIGPNSPEWNVTDNRFKIAPYYNVTSVCPHIYMAYILRCCFTEFGYSINGKILEDEMFKKICMLSFTGVYWSQLDDRGTYYEPDPLSSVTINLAEHVPQDITIGEFLVELCKFLPLGFEIDDNSRTCTIKTLGQPSEPSRLKDVTAMVSPNITAGQSDTTGRAKVWGIRRNFNTDQLAGGVADLANINFSPGREQDWLPLPTLVLGGEAYRLVFDNGYYAKFQDGGVYETIRMGDNLGSYEPADATDFIETNIAPVSNRSGTELSGQFQIPHCYVEGNWNSKPEKSVFGIHVCFYHGKNFPFENNPAKLCTYASSTNNKWVVGGSGSPVPEINGTWSMAYELGTYGMYDYWWKEWLKILGEQETLKARLLLPITDYLKLKWGDELLIENTSYILKKISEVLPYRDGADIEAVRWIKG
jgi:hypothetical protein